MGIESGLAVIESKETKMNEQDKENMNIINKAFKDNIDGDDNAILNTKEGPVKDAWDNLSKKFPLNRVQNLDLKDGTRQKRTTTFSVDFVHDKIQELATEEQKGEAGDPHIIQNTQKLLHHYGLYDKESFASLDGVDGDGNSNIDGKVGSGTKDAVSRWNNRYGTVFNKNISV